MFQPRLSLAVATAIIVLLLIKKVLERRKALPLPPGPKPWPLLGNITDMPPQGQVEWRHWLKHKDLYGPLSSVTALGQTIIVVHDKQAALELMEKRAASHSGRPSATFAMEMCGLDKILASRQPGPSLHLHRKLANSQLGSQAAVLRFVGLQEAEVGRFLVRLLDNSGVGLDGAIKRQVLITTLLIFQAVVAENR
ncbi:hypothetical protein N8I77_005311 [Diaporthe amygdali]|uniref:Uncharacterized protein n=1 Tax=Phomopsis amygdali TaxID=1214568 RepID=A0AAD9SFP3_PHOAM|nr:hypothetical protein N8I77_005311 [Diaporthe amygdali]